MKANKLLIISVISLASSLIGCGKSLTYKVTLDILGETPSKDVNVCLYNGEALVKTAKTNVKGEALFYNVKKGEYDVKLETLNDGYHYESEVKTNIDEKEYTLSLYTSLIEGAKVSGKRYSLGDVVRDVSYDTLEKDENDKYISKSIKELLDGKDIAMITFWATWCPPCAAEFPHIEDFMQDVSDVVGYVAINDDMGDTPESVIDYKNNGGYTFDMAKEGNSKLSQAFNVKYIPTTIIIDRYGRYVDGVEKAFPSKRSLINFISDYVGEDYVPDYSHYE